MRLRCDDSGRRSFRAEEHIYIRAGRFEIPRGRTAGSAPPGRGTSEDFAKSPYILWPRATRKWRISQDCWHVFGDVVTLSYCCRSLDDDREMFPGSVLMSAFRILSGKHDGDQDAFLKWVRDPISFAAQNSEQCSNISEWWLWRACGDKEIMEPQKLVAKSFPHLGQGMVARSQRQSDLFTEYDGWVPQAGVDLDPTSPNGPILSSSRLEKLGSCPLEYFFRYVLEVKITRRIQSRSISVVGSSSERDSPPLGISGIHGNAEKRRPSS